MDRRLLALALAAVSAAASHGCRIDYGVPVPDAAHDTAPPDTWEPDTSDTAGDLDEDSPSDMVYDDAGDIEDPGVDDTAAGDADLDPPWDDPASDPDAADTMEVAAETMDDPAGE